MVWIMIFRKIKIISICFILLSSFNLYAQTKTPHKTETPEINSTEGIIIKVNTEDSSFLIKHTSRIIKFKASNKIISEYKNKNNMKVQIYYQKLKDGTLFITDLKPAN
jgi:hypothetical protein